MIVSFSLSDSSNNRFFILSSELTIRVRYISSNILLNNRYLIGRISNNTIITSRVLGLSNRSLSYIVSDLLLTKNRELRLLLDRFLILDIDSNLVLQLGNSSKSSRTIRINRLIRSSNKGLL